LIQNYIYFFGIWEPNLSKFISHRLASGSVFVDVGANVGYFALLASTLVGDKGRVIAVEASPKIYGLLQRNIQLNNSSNIRALNIAAGESTGTISVFSGGQNNIGSTNTIGTLGGEYEAEVSVMPLDEMISPDIWKNVRLIKIDVEGAELSVVRGMQRLLDSSNEDLELVIEINPSHLQEQGCHPNEIISVLRKRGFFPYVLANDYSADYYLLGKHQVYAKIISTEIVERTDVIFSWPLSTSGECMY
jgi:FkbM family methyltransferase